MTVPCDQPAQIRAPAPLTRDHARRIVDTAVARWAIDAHARVPGFVERQFGLRGSLSLHRHSLGWDLARAPVNAFGSVLTAGKNLAAAGLAAGGGRRPARRLREINLLLDTDLGRELEWRIQTEVLILPIRQKHRAFTRDTLLEAVLADSEVAFYLAETLRELARRGDAPEFRERLEDTLNTYLGSRAAASDITVSLLAAASGFAAYQQVTPGVAALSSSLAGTIAYHSAVSGFWAGPWAGSLYYTAVGVSTPPLLAAGVFTGLLVPAAVLAAFAGVVADPVQKRFGLHRRRLDRLVDTVAGRLRRENAYLPVRDHYVARLMDLVDWTQVALRALR